MKLLIVESPAKSKTINAYLGKSFKVVASFGHIMELPSKPGSVEPDSNFAMHYQISSKSVKTMANIVQNAKDAEEIYLATDPDREGEAISAGIIEGLKQKKVPLSKKKIYRVAFNQITEKAIKDAIKKPRSLDENLVNAQRARVALDYLVGFNLSPILWKKLPGSKSAGRVQSVALRILCERENEILDFKKEEFWEIHAHFITEDGQTFHATLETLENIKLEKFSLPDEKTANKALKSVKGDTYSVFKITSKEIKRKPYAPFMTSSLQQDASSRLGFSPKKTMLIAQRLYEGIQLEKESKGIITYMRTDSPTISDEGVGAIRSFLEKDYGSKYLSEKTRIYVSKAKNSQEAHEAIRPTDPFLTPQKLQKYLQADELKLYTLIWKRAVASQMSEAVFQSTKLEVKGNLRENVFKSNGSILVFEGYQKVYDYSESEDNRLPAISEKDSVTLKEVIPEQNFTSPPSRYGEASLVKKLEELGIGRPSTYASTLAVLQEREYVRLEDKKMVPEERGRIVTVFLEKFFSKYVAYDFTAHLEEELDRISNGDLPKDIFLQTFWKDFKKTFEESRDKTPLEVSKAIESQLGNYFFKEKEGIQKCTVCETGEMHIKIGKFGSFFACNNYPACKNIINPHKEEYIQEKGRILGTNDKGNEIQLKKGPYGYYIELNDNSKKPRRVSLPTNIAPENLSLQEALEMFIFPKIIGRHPEGGEITSCLGPYGPYIAHNKKYYKLPDIKAAQNIELDEALTIIASGSKKKVSNKTKV